MEIIILVTIIGLQAYIAFSTWRSIIQYTGAFPGIGKMKLLKIFVSPSDINDTDPKQILSNLSKYITPEEQSASIDIIQPDKKFSPAFAKILESLNTYLIRNRTSAPEFNLVKDIVERNCEALENEINTTISIPLYLGLMGTLVGVIFGLWNISDVSGEATTTDILDKAIPILLGGVKVAMIASLTGLALTVLNSGYFFRKAKTEVEGNKNDFYTFLQIELMPLLNQGINASIYSLHANLGKFNDEFSRNLTKLGGLMYKNHNAILAQEKILTSIENNSINELAKFNVEVLEELKSSIDSFHVFNLYMGGVNNALENTGAIIEQLNRFADSTESITGLADNINSSFVENARLIKFFNDHHKSLDQSQQALADAVGRVGKSLSDAVSEMEFSTKERIIQMKEIMTVEINKMTTEYPQQWKKLDNLEEIKTIISNNRDMIVLLKDVIKSSDDNNKTLKQINNAIGNLNHSSTVSEKKGSIIKRAYLWLFNK